MNIDDIKSASSEVCDTDHNRETSDTPYVPPKFPTVNPDGASVVSSWMDAMSAGVLSPTHFREYWRVWVPKIYSPTPNDDCLHWMFNEDLAQKLLYNTLEEFICNGDPAVILKRFSQMDAPPSVCGRVFNIDELYYSCDECAVVYINYFCVNCFKQSAHRHHRYTIGVATAGIGGCDCGDPDIWKSAPWCATHEVGHLARETESSLPEDVQERARAIFEAVFMYCHEVLSLDHVPGLPPQICVREAAELRDLLTDTYCTVLFNDKTHTFDDVINMLVGVINCSQRNAVEYVSNVDREGRAVIMCSGFQHCEEVRKEIEGYTSSNCNRPLMVQVVHTLVIAHQIFALKLLGWFQQFIGNCKGFRVIFSDIALNSKLPKTSIIEDVFMKNSHPWKAVQRAWYNLFISGMLKDFESKKALAIVFASHYGSIMKNFIREAHDGSFLIDALSFKLFIGPTLAHYLIAHEDVLFTLLNTFISESSRQCNAIGKLEFRNIPNTSFERADYIFVDLIFLLRRKPEKWTDALRRGFVQGMSLLLVLLTSMQSMDAVTRQVEEHVEYEPEWGSAFNLHIEILPVINLALKWCGSDKFVLVKVYNCVMKILYEEAQRESERSPPTEVKKLAGHEANCINYDVSSKKVSIHQPLSRFLAGLYLHLEKYDLHFHSKHFNMKKLAPEKIIEPVLRVQAMISQVHAGMWQRNGDWLFDQISYYLNVKCRTELLDRDIVLLQFGAAYIQSDKFLIQILHKYNLLHWASPILETEALDEDSTTQTIYLMEEFLGLLITIIGERHVPGIGQVTAEDRLKKEIIQQLCIEPLSHSELNDRLPGDENYATGLENVIDEMAELKKPLNSFMGKGIYELKPHLYSEYNVFFYHYTKDEIIKSEEAQRKRRLAAGELECCPPPKLPKLAESVTFIVNLLQCDVMLHIMQLVLKRALNLRARSFSELQVHKVLHLIGYALQEQESQNYVHILDFTTKANKWKIFELLEDLTTSPRIDAEKDLLTWVLAKYKEVSRSKDIVAPTTLEWLVLDSSLNSTVALGNGQTVRVCTEETYICILCQENQTISDGPALVMPAFIQQSTVLCQNREKLEETNPLYLSANLGASVHTSTCGHVIHAVCWQSYCVAKNEYLCPVCECLSNTVLPLLPTLGTLQPTTREKVELSFDSWVLGLKTTLNSRTKESTDKMAFPCYIETIQKDLGLGNDFQKLYSEVGPNISENLVAIINLFAQSMYDEHEDDSILEAIIHLFAQSTDDEDLTPHEDDSQIPLLVWKSTAYTVHAIEFLLRDTNKPLLGAFSSRQKSSLEQLTRISAILGTTWTDNSAEIGNHASNLLTMLLENPHEGDSVLDWDPFGVLVPLVVSISSLFNTKIDSRTRIITGGLAEAHVLRLVFLSLVVKILLTMNFNETQNLDVDGQELEDKDKYRSLLKLIESVNLKIREENLPDVWRRLKNGCMPFLRCCALYFHFVTDVPAPVELTRQGGDTYENVCKYLGLPVTCDELLEPEIVTQLATTWATHPRIADKDKAVKEPLKVTKLVDLPDDYIDLLNNAVLTFTCPKRDHGDSIDIAMCLVCGTMLCSQRYCCQMELNNQNVGVCTYHASKCCAGVGIFLRMRDCEILFLRSPNSFSFICSPYLDKYGETDQGLHRGNPLWLCKDKYKQLSQMWLSHGLPEAIERAINSPSNLEGSTPCQQL